ncbi:hypothetical protein Pcinc_008663 [Petrolisthes cinctipes]|nr:hypothetical protein Pcinc_008663 [Petrolisthes cinctipes]
MKEMQKVYGDVFRTRVGSCNSVYICKYRLIREAFNKVEFSDRPSWKFIDFFSDGKEAGVVFRNGPVWVKLRRFLLRHLRDLGMGKSRLDDAILQEAQELVMNFKNHVDRPTNFPISINTAILNVIWQMVASRRYDLNDKQTKEFSDMMVKYQDDLMFLALPEFFPWLNYLPACITKRLCRVEQLEASAKLGKAMMEEVIAKHRENFDPASPRDLLDEFLLEMKAVEDSSKDVGDTPFNEIDLVRTIFDLFTAGYDTTANMLRWVILYMAAYPRVQLKVQEELDEVVPRDTLPSHQYRHRLSYLEAMIHEVLRVSSIVTGGVPHVTAQDTHFAGYFLPKGTMISGYNLACHMNPESWEDPEVFQPERFLDEVGKFIAPKVDFLPFGVGKRSCLGEALARMELYIFSAAILQNFKFASVSLEQPVDLSPRPISNLMFPKDQLLLITLREDETLVTRLYLKSLHQEHLSHRCHHAPPAGKAIATTSRKSHRHHSRNSHRHHQQEQPTAQ